MNVLSLFDGISCGHVALERAGIKVANYYASEIDENAIKVTMLNYPNTIQLGSVISCDKWVLPKIDLLIGGSPCQSFSVSNVNRDGFDSDNGKLFYKYLDMLNTYKPAYFLYENVAKMRKSDEIFITEKLGVSPVCIDSALFSAQSRNRNYWTNIPILDLPKVLSPVLVKDILEDTSKVKPMLREVVYDNLDKEIPASGISRIGYSGDCRRGNRVYDINAKGITITRNSGGLGRITGLYKVGDVIRRLSPLEAELMQTLPNNYTACLKDNTRYQAIGNGWTVDVIAHIFEGLK